MKLKNYIKTINFNSINKKKIFLARLRIIIQTINNNSIKLLTIKVLNTKIVFLNKKYKILITLIIIRKKNL